MQKLTPNQTFRPRLPEWASRYRASGSALLFGGVLCLPCACDTNTRSQGEAASRVEQTESLRAAGGAPPASGEPGPPQTVHAGPETAGKGRPSVDHNMGRGFQGTLAMRIRAPSSERTLRYQTRGNRARLQIDAPSGSAPKETFDALIWDQNISTLDHERRTYHTVALADVKAREEPDVDVSIDKTGERSILSGVTCERYEITQGELHVSACVSPLPGSFDVNKLETTSGIDVPPWAEQLLESGLMPLTAKAKDAAGRELYSLELIEYSAGSVDEAVVTLPTNYRAGAAGGASKPLQR